MCVCAVILVVTDLRREPCDAAVCTRLKPTHLGAIIETFRMCAQIWRGVRTDLAARVLWENCVLWAPEINVNAVE